MKTFLKVFIISFICFTLLFAGVVMAILKTPDESTIGPIDDPNIVDSSEPSPTLPVKEKTELEKLVEESKRVNVLLMGLEGPRTDTLVLASFDPKSKNVDLIHIPRDTYYPVKGYDAADQKKINAVYGRAKTDGIMNATSHILNVPVHHYVKVSYKAVENIVDSLGGVEATIPFDMDYDDPYSNPPLHIHLKKGTRTLMGKEAIQFLRFRQNNDKSHSDGDIGRINRQQEFLKSAAKKALSLKKLPVVAHTVFKFVKTSMDLDEIAYYATKAIGISTNDIKTYKLPGKPKGISYYFHDSEETEKLMIEIYKKGSDN